MVVNTNPVVYVVQSNTFKFAFILADTLASGQKLSKLIKYFDLNAIPLPRVALQRTGDVAKHNSIEYSNKFDPNLRKFENKILKDDIDNTARVTNDVSQTTSLVSSIDSGCRRQ